MALGMIPYVAMIEYTAFHGFTREEAYVFVRVIREIDNAYMVMVSKRAERQPK